MRKVIGEVVRFAIQYGLTTTDPVQATRGAIATPRARNHSAIIDPVRYGELLSLIDTYAETNAVTGIALQLMALLYRRPGELRQPEWAEFVLERARWTVPAERMKMRIAHAKPLPRQAVAILARLKAITGQEGLVFPAAGKGRQADEREHYECRIATLWRCRRGACVTRLPLQCEHHA